MSAPMHRVSQLCMLPCRVPCDTMTVQRRLSTFQAATCMRFILSCHASAHLRPAAGVEAGAAKPCWHRLRPVKQLEAPVTAVQAEHSGARGSLCGQD